MNSHCLTEKIVLRETPEAICLNQAILKVEAHSQPQDGPADPSERKFNSIRGVVILARMLLLVAAGWGLWMIFFPSKLQPLVRGTVVPASVRHIVAYVDGRVIEVCVEQGQRVTPDTIIARIDAADEVRRRREIDSDMLIIVASISSARIELKHAEREHQLFVRLQAAGAVSLLEMERTRATVDNCHAKLAELDAQCAALDVRRSNVIERIAGGEVVKAGCAGFVASRISDILHTRVQSGDNICEIADQLVVELKVDEDLLSRIPERGLLLSFPSTEHLLVRGTITEIIPVVAQDPAEDWGGVAIPRARVLVSAELPSSIQWGMSCQAFLGANVRTPVSKWLTALNQRIDSMFSGEQSSTSETMKCAL